MSLSDLAALGSFISGVAVLVSLIFLYFQLRQVNAQVIQAERNQRALMQQGRANRTSENCFNVAEPDLSSIYGRGVSGDESLTAEQLDQFMMLTRAGLISIEDSFLQNRGGPLDTVAFDSFVAGVRFIFTLPGMRAAWRLSAHQFGKEFASFMNGMMEEIEVAPEGGRLMHWIEALKSEKVTRIAQRDQ
jgi:hypothetical protein